MKHYSYKDVSSYEKFLDSLPENIRVELKLLNEADKEAGKF